MALIGKWAFPLKPKAMLIAVNSLSLFNVGRQTKLTRQLKGSPGMNVSRIRQITTAILATTLTFGLTATPASANPAGPHLDGNAYDALRPQGPTPTLTFNLRSEFKGEVLRSHITIGPDFVTKETKGFVKVHDFRFRRLLAIDVETGYFSNESFYGHFRSRWALLLNNIFATSLMHRMTEKNERSLGLDRFLIEHAVGADCSRQPRFQHLPNPSVDINRQDMDLTVNVEGTEILKAVFDPIRFPSDAHKQSFAAWLIWQIRLHPKVAQAVIEVGMLPVYLQTVRQKLTESEDPVLSLSLSEPSHATGRLDALAGLTPDIPDTPHLPKKMARLMIDAALGQASNGPLEDSFYVGNICELIASRSYLDAALLSFHATFQYEGCNAPHSDQILCKMVRDALLTAHEEGSVKELFRAMELSLEKKHEQAIETLMPLREKVRSRPDILEFMIANEIISIRRASNQNKTGEDEIYIDEFGRLPHTLTTALAADPYSPARYRDIFNYFSVGARTTIEGYEAPILEHFVLDLARTLPNQRMPKIINDLTALEKKITADHPMLFPKTTETIE